MRLIPAALTIAALCTSATALAQHRGATAPPRSVEIPTNLDRRDLPVRADQARSVVRPPSTIPQMSAPVYLDRSAGDASDVYHEGENGRWWVRMNLDENGRPTRTWGRNADGRYWIMRSMQAAPQDSTRTRPNLR